MFVPWLTVMPRPATKSSSSSWVMPLMTGTRANCPRARAVPIDWVSTVPSTTPGISTPKLLTRSLTGALRRHAALWSGQPTAVANVSPAASAVASGRWFRANVPLCTMARWKSPRAPGETIWARTDRPPADWPAMVTLRGSPPNRAMLRWTQRRAACWSIRP